MGRSNRQDLYTEVTERVIDAMERDGVAPWRRPWTMRGSSMPRNAVSGHPYRGVNVMLVLLAASERGYTDPRWLTFKQANDLASRAARAAGRNVVQNFRGHWVYADGPDKGRSCGGVRKGQNAKAGQGGTGIVLWKPIASEDAKGNERRGLVARTYYVFNVQQCDDAVQGWILARDRVEPFDSIDAAERICEGFAVTTTHGGDVACYIPALDVIRLPVRESFRSPEAYYSVRFHEMGHATGHASRLARPGITALDHFGSHQYSQEELVAEFCALYLCAESGIERTVEANSTSYLKHWASKLREDPRMLVLAAQRAQHAADFILGRAATAEAGETEGASA